ncbi:MAG: hypothetical protein Q4G45_14370, partial [Actinomycetia bacterium]|nr:hypothetical protein [Actinomycetes bacterium]
MSRTRTILLGLVAALAVAFVALAPSAPQASAEPRKPRTPITALTNVRLATTMSVAAQPGDQTHMVITGRLVDQLHRPVGGVPVQVRIDGAAVGSAQTNGSGSFSVRAPVPGPGAHQAEALFTGHLSWEGSSATADFIVQGSAATTQATTQPPATQPTGSGTTLTANAAPNPVRLGGTVTVSGTLVGPRGPVG